MCSHWPAVASQFLCNQRCRRKQEAKEHQQGCLPKEQEPVSKIITLTCEAFVQLVLKNNESQWKVEWQINDLGMQGASLPKLKCMQGKASGGKNLGWMDDSMWRHNMLSGKVIENCKMDVEKGDNSAEKR